MRILRRLPFVTWCLLLPLLGTALPHAALWRCAHATQSVLLLPSPQAMPCAMPGQMTMAAMACCRVRTSPSQAARSRAALQAPPCKPTLTPAAAFAPARITPAQTFLSPAPLVASAFAPFIESVLSAPGQTALRLRGPPDTALPAPHRCSPVGLRASPIA